MEKYGFQTNIYCRPLGGIFAKSSMAKTTSESLGLLEIFSVSLRVLLYTRLKSQIYKDGEQYEYKLKLENIDKKLCIKVSYSFQIL